MNYKIIYFIRSRLHSLAINHKKYKQCFRFWPIEMKKKIKFIKNLSTYYLLEDDEYEEIHNSSEKYSENPRK